MNLKRLPYFLRTVLELRESDPELARAACEKPGAKERLLGDAVSAGSLEALDFLAPLLTFEMLNPSDQSFLNVAMQNANARALKSDSEDARTEDWQGELAAFLGRLIDLGASPEGAVGSGSPLRRALYIGPVIFNALMDKGASPCADDLLLGVMLRQPRHLAAMLPRAGASASILARLSERAAQRRGSADGSSLDCSTVIEAFKARREREDLDAALGQEPTVATRLRLRV